jgi:hypothetical protein
MKALLISLALALSLTGAARAHHGWSGYDSSKPLKMTGRIVESGYEHPHGYVRLEVEGKTWRVVLAPPSRMKYRGLAREDLEPGRMATVEGYPSREDAAELRAEQITTGGKTVALR